MQRAWLPIPTFEHWALQRCVFESHEHRPAERAQATWERYVAAHFCVHWLLYQSHIDEYREQTALVVKEAQFWLQRASDATHMQSGSPVQPSTFCP
jgi:hypothetical protein